MTRGGPAGEPKAPELSGTRSCSKTHADRLHGAGRPDTVHLSLSAASDIGDRPNSPDGGNSSAIDCTLMQQGGLGRGMTWPRPNSTPGAAECGLCGLWECAIFRLPRRLPDRWDCSC
jgi:hypothetical protein